MADFDPIASGQAINQGLAQVFSPYKDEITAKRIAAAEKAEEEKSTQTKSVMKSLAGLEDIDILPGDQKRFADMQKDIYDYTSKNIDQIRKGDAGALIEFQKKLTEYSNKANHSKAWKKLTNDTGKEIALNPDKFSAETRTGWLGMNESSFDEEGNPRSWDFGFIKPAEPQWLPGDYFAGLWKKNKPNEEQKITSYNRATGEATYEANKYYNRLDLLAQDELKNPFVRKNVENDFLGLPLEKQDEYEAMAEEQGILDESGNPDPLSAYFTEQLEERAPYQTKQKRTGKPFTPRTTTKKDDGGGGGKGKIVDLTPTTGPARINLKQIEIDEEGDPVIEDDSYVYASPLNYTLPATYWKFDKENVVLNASKYYNPKPDDTEKAGDWINESVQKPSSISAIIEVPWISNYGDFGRAPSEKELKTKKWGNKKQKGTPKIIKKKFVIFDNPTTGEGWADFSEPQVQEAVRNSGVNIDPLLGKGSSTQPQSKGGGSLPTGKSNLPQGSTTETR